MKALSNSSGNSGWFGKGSQLCPSQLDGDEKQPMREGLASQGCGSNGLPEDAFTRTGEVLALEKNCPLKNVDMCCSGHEAKEYLCW